MSGAARATQAPGASQAAPTASPGPSPGKAPLTAGMARETGIPVVDFDHAAAAERDPSRYWLSPSARSELRRTLGERVQMAHVAYGTVLSEKRIELLLTPDEGWSPVAKMLLTVASMAASGAVLKALTSLRAGAKSALVAQEVEAMFGGESVKTWTKIAARIPVETVKLGLSQASITAMSLASSASKGVPPVSQAKAAFLRNVADAAMVLAQSVREDLPVVLDDDSLLLLVESYDAQFHSRAYYATEVDSLLERFQAQQIPAIGLAPSDVYRLDMEPPSNRGRLDAVRFMAGGRSRVGLVAQPHTIRRLHEQTPGATRATDAESLREASFVRWVDDDLAEAATSAHETRTGTTLTVDAMSAPRSMAEVYVWAATVKLGGSP